MSWLRSRAVAALSACAVAVSTLLALPAPASAIGESLLVQVLCVSPPLTGSTWQAHFRVFNPAASAVVVPWGATNTFLSARALRGQPTSFPAGQSSFTTDFTVAEGAAAWALTSNTATANQSSPRCETKVSDVVVAGVPAVGSVLTMAGERVDLAVEGYDVIYRWFVDCDTTPVEVATGRSYVPQAADAGKRLGATITYARGSNGLTIASSCTDPVDITPGTLMPPYRSFPHTAVGGSSVQLVYYLNDTAAPVTLGELTVSGPDAESFRVFDDDCESFIPVRGGCTIEVAFEPRTAGTFTAQLHVDDGAGTSATLAGTAGLAPSRSATPRVSGTPAIGQPLTVTDGGWVGDPTVTIEWEACTPLACRRVDTGPSFTPSAEEVGDSIRAVVTATNDFGTDRIVTAAVGPVPAAPGPPPPPAPVPAPAALALGATRADLGKVPVRKQGKVRTVTISNTGGSPLVVRSVTLSGRHRKDVVLATTCPGDTLSPGASCTVSLRLKPSAAGRRAASLVVATTAGAQTVALTGQGVRHKR